MAHGSQQAKANVSASATDDTGLSLSGVAGKKIIVEAVSLVAGGTATDVTFNTKGSGSGTAISPVFACPSNGGPTLPYTDKGWFETNTGEALTVNTGTGSTVRVAVIARYKLA